MTGRAPDFFVGTPEELLDYCVVTGRSYVKLEFGQDDKDLGEMVIELYTDQCPRTCKNFINLIKGKGRFCYKGSPIHRVVPSGYVQGGDVVDGSGKGDPGFHIDDESFAVKHDQPGIIGMANLGQPHTASSQFYITLNPLPWLDGKRVAFGRVLTSTGMDALKGLCQLPLYTNERPVPDLLIRDCSVLYEPPATS